MSSEKVLVEASPKERASSHKLPGFGGDGGGEGGVGGAGLDAWRHSVRAASSRSLNSSPLTVPEGRPLRASGVAKQSRDVVTWSGPKFGRSARI